MGRTPEEEAAFRAAIANLMFKYEARVNGLLDNDAAWSPERIQETRKQLKADWLAFRDTVGPRPLE
jgi:hypothetical protein